MLSEFYRTAIVKNPEYCINGLVADRKAVKSEDGVASGFVKAIKQGCSAIVFDLDEHLKDKLFYTGKFAQAIGNRYRDFETGAIKEVIVIKNNKAALIRASKLKFTDRRSCKNEIEPLLKQIAERKTFCYYNQDTRLEVIAPLYSRFNLSNANITQIIGFRLFPTEKYCINFAKKEAAHILTQPQGRR
ncbi:MAG: hypothetical protein K2K33_06625 [Muribaculaceae bacterium]|nr:hypothetical protein [Muribaculaceae bacterium]